MSSCGQNKTGGSRSKCPDCDKTSCNCGPPLAPKPSSKSHNPQGRVPLPPGVQPRNTALPSASRGANGATS
ncbi:uncharacterized protein P884DRAFT_253406 [Thermothelomyces heterothallicus CBS 202.75]|uniref:uncharacterized protein n=1 Tax=Thermothelomyces heterothallicus CBS 202.75 TaxID=1149848 RepID=UPI00374473FF